MARKKWPSSNVGPSVAVVCGEVIVNIRRTRLARLVKGFLLATLTQLVDAVCVIASIFMPLPGGIGSQTLVQTGSANVYKSYM